MKKTFIKTKNVKRFVALMDELQKLPPNIPKLALVYGDHGLGKTNAIIGWATRTNQFRQLVKLINKIEKLSETNEIEEIDEYTLKGLLNERQTALPVQAIKKRYA